MKKIALITQPRARPAHQGIGRRDREQPHRARGGLGRPDGAGIRVDGRRVQQEHGGEGQRVPRQRRRRAAGGQQRRAQAASSGFASRCRDHRQHDLRFREGNRRHGLHGPRRARQRNHAARPSQGPRHRSRERGRCYKMR